MHRNAPIVAAMLVSLAASSAFAHVGLAQGKAPVGATYKAVFTVPHGCAGKATVALRIQIPEGVIGVKPMPKPGWTLTKTRGKYEKTHAYYGSQVSDGVKEIDWTGGNLPDDEYDEFVLIGFLASDLPVGQVLYFPAVQECEGGTATHWIEIPQAGEDEHSLEHPAPGVKLLEAQPGGGD